MITLENIMKTAQRSANQNRRPMTVWNLNRYSPLYVVRLACEGDATRKGPGTFVATVQPENVAADAAREDDDDSDPAADRGDWQFHRDHDQ